MSVNESDDSDASPAAIPVTNWPRGRCTVTLSMSLIMGIYMCSAVIIDVYIRKVSRDNGCLTKLWGH